MLVKINEVQLNEVILEVTPGPLNGVQLLTIRQQPHAPHVLWLADALAGVRAAVIRPQDILAVGERLVDGVQKELKGVGV